VLWTKGVETGRITPNEFVRVTSTNIAQILNIYPQKGAILPGSDADLVVWDPKLSKTISAANQKSIIDYNVFEGFAVNGLARYTLSRGEVVWSPRSRQARQAQAVPGRQQGAVDLEGIDRAARHHAFGRTYADRRVIGQRPPPQEKAADRVPLDDRPETRHQAFDAGLVRRPAMGCQTPGFRVDFCARQRVAGVSLRLVDPA
jgi:hypothetical protein